MSRLMLDDSPPPLSAADSDDSAELLLARRLALSDSLAASYPAAALSNALRDAPGAAALDDDDLGTADPLSRSCFASLRASPGGGSAGSELGDLDWLVNYRPPDLSNPSVAEDLAAELDAAAASATAAAAAAAAAEVAGEMTANRRAAASASVSASQFHSDYDPQRDRLLKPPYSFSCLIFMALEAAPGKCLPVRRIYQWIEQKFPYYRHAQNGWKNSVRHNLSLNKSFTKVQRDIASAAASESAEVSDDDERDETPAKGSLWTIDPMARAGMLQALKKTPYHPYAQVQMFSATGTMYKTSGSGAAGLKREARSSPQPLQQQQQQQQHGPVYSGLLGTNVLITRHAATIVDDSGSTVDDKAATQEQQERMQYHPNVNSFKGHVTPKKGPPTLKPAPPLLLPPPQPPPPLQPHQQQAAIKSEDDLAADDATDDEKSKRQRCRKQDLLPSAHLYPFLAAKMKRLVHILGDQACDAQHLNGADGSSSGLGRLRRQRGDGDDFDEEEEDEEDDDEDGYVEIEQPIKRPRGRPRKDSAPIYRLLPPARLLKKKKRKRRSSGMPSVNQLVAAAQMAQMKRAAAAAAAAVASSSGAAALDAVVSAAAPVLAPISLPPAPKPAPAPAPAQAKPRLPDAHALYLKYRQSSGGDDCGDAASSSASSASDRVPPRRLPPLTGSEAQEKIPLEEASVLASLALNIAKQPSSASAAAGPAPPVVSIVKSPAGSSASLCGSASRVHILQAPSITGGGGIVVKLAGKPLN